MTYGSPLLTERVRTKKELFWYVIYVGLCRFTTDRYSCAPVPEGLNGPWVSQKKEVSSYAETFTTQAKFLVLPTTNMRKGTSFHVSNNHIQNVLLLHFSS